jgi:hypothetical protein
MHAAVADIALQISVFAGVKQADKMHTVFRHRLEAAKGEDACLPGRLNEAGGVFDAIVICYRNNFDALLLTGRQKGRIVFGFVLKGGLLLVPSEIRERVNLQGAAIEPRPAWETQRGF